MAESTISTANIQTQFDTKVRKTYVREGRYGPYIGNTENDIIQVNNDLKKHSISLIGSISGSGVRGSSSLVGAEQAISNYAATFQPTHIRNGVLISNEENEKSAFDLKAEAKPTLMNWMMEQKRDQITQAFGAIEAGGVYYNYGGVEASGATGSSAASAANMDTWNTNNTDRILYGAAKANTTAGDHTTSLGTIDTTNDKLDTGALSLLKRIAADANPLIRPVMLNEDEPFFVYFVGKYGFRDLKQDTVMLQANREARERSAKNPLFTGGDLMWDNILIKEVPDLDKFIDSTSGGMYDGIWGAGATGDSLKTSGGSGSRIGVGFLCGAQAICFGMGKMAEFKVRKEDDYEHLNGVAIVAKHDIKKIFYNGKQHGMVTHFHSATLDS